jgi:hypothetical protein
VHEAVSAEQFICAVHEAVSAGQFICAVHEAVSAEQFICAVHEAVPAGQFINLPICLLPDKFYYLQTCLKYCQKRKLTNIIYFSKLL